MCRRRSFEEEEIKILTADQITRVTDILVGHPLYEIAVVNLATVACDEERYWLLGDRT